MQRMATRVKAAGKVCRFDFPQIGGLDLVDVPEKTSLLVLGPVTSSIGPIKSGDLWRS